MAIQYFTFGFIFLFPLFDMQSFNGFYDFFSISIAILNAMNEGKCINFKYKPVRRDVAEYQLMPLGVFKYDSGYYLAAQKLPEGEYRSFGPFGHKDEFEAVLKFDSFHGFYNMEEDWPNAVKIEEQEDESVIMRAKTCSYSGIRQFIMGFGNGVEVLEPEWLRNSIRDNHIRAAQVYLSIDSPHLRCFKCISLLMTPKNTCITEGTK